LGAIRIDSGNAEDEARRARTLLDELGATDTLIIVSGDMDEYSIDELVSSGAPIDGFGVGTSVVTGSGHPAAGFVYKLVAIATEDGAGAPMHPVAKLSSAKRNVGGAKRAWRVLDDEGFAVEEFVEPGPPTTACPALENRRCRALQVALIDDGETVHRRSLDEIRAHHAAAIAELRESHRSITDGPPALSAAPPIAPPSAEDRPEPKEPSWTPPAPS
jgi:nicotinate phosphoribosyltransferase